MAQCSASPVPIQKGDKFRLMQCPKNNLERKQMEGIPYASVVGSLMYAQTCTKPDISFAVGMLGRYQSNPGLDHWKAAKKVLRYLQGTKEHMLTYRRSNHLEVIGYSDLDFAGCVNTRKSTFGYLYLLARGAISWKSAKQSVIATSTMEAEFVACFEAMVQAKWLRNFFSGLKIVDSIARPLKIYCDNSATNCLLLRHPDLFIRRFEVIALPDCTLHNRDADRWVGLYQRHDDLADETTVQLSMVLGHGRC
ncbi:secreted RxLR effector protein 161-like [Arachis hypogaea]|uniref:secreted RxLR effector protein 161-like n=1 Tax=Arachis hypogaea TaxID=3818 RepID=UPI003B210767